MQGKICWYLRITMQYFGVCSDSRKTGTWRRVQPSVACYQYSGTARTGARAFCFHPFIDPPPPFVLLCSRLAMLIVFMSTALTASLTLAYHFLSNSTYATPLWTDLEGSLGIDSYTRTVLTILPRVVLTIPPLIGL